jgi:hypothetical protein
MVSMRAPDGSDLAGTQLPRSSPAPWTAARRETLASCLAITSPRAGPALAEALSAALAAGGAPFEAVCGCPAGRYGARLTISPGVDRRAFARVLGIHEHPLGPPDWAGLRALPDGTLRTKPYHRLPRLDARAWAEGRFCAAGRSLPVPEGLPEALRSVMVSVDGEDVELYLRLGAGRSWTSFVARSTAAFGGCTYPFSPHPRPVDQAFCLSLRWRDERLAAVTVYADDRALPADAEIPRLWEHGMGASDRSAYEAALAAVRSLASNRRGWHALLGWTVEQDATWHRAASLRVPT